MLSSIVLLLIGLVLLALSGDWLVEGVSSLAKKWGVSLFLISVTIVSFGTSLPEVLVNIISSLRGNYDVGMGNIIGSNISNTLLVLGISAIFVPLMVDKTTVNKYIPFSILSVIVLFALANGSLINGGSSLGGLFRSGGIVLLCFFLVFLYSTLSEKKEEVEEEKEKEKEKTIFKAWFLTIIGLAGLYGGAELTVHHGVIIAESIGFSEAFIGLTVVALGTSLPELAACISAATKRKYGIIWGNIVGSNIFNILWVLGISSTIKPIEYSSMLDLDIGLVLGSSLILLPLIIFGRKNFLSRNAGILLVVLYIFYLTFVFYRG